MALAVPAAAESQDARLRVKLEDEVGRPVMGALVALVDAENRMQAEGLSSEDGRRTLSAPPGAYTVRVRRIGFQPFVSGPVTLPYDGELRLTVESRRVVLDTVRVAARSRCRPAGRDAEQLATVWEEVRKALRSSELSLDDLIGIGLARSYRREAYLGGGVVLSDTTTFVVRDRKPFGAADPTALALEGYVRGDVRRGWEFFGPDETVLLSDEFANTHCFRLVRERRRPGQIGVAFEPEPGRRTADIAGVLWVDETNAELREVRYRFVAGGVLRGVEAGGFTRFRRMPSGAWLVEEWQLRMPRLAIGPGAGEHIVSIGFVETGGGILDRRTPSYGEATGTVSGVVYDSIALRPIAGAIVTLGETVARTDEGGRFWFTGTPLGVHTISFTHPTLSAFGVLAIQRTLEVSGASTEVVLATPSLARAWEQICGEAPPSRRRAILHGVVRSEEDEPVVGAAVRVNWTEARLQPGADALPQFLDLTTDGEGRFVACGLAATAGGSAAARAGELSGRREFRFTPEEPIIRRDLVLARGDRSVTAESHDILAVTDSALAGSDVERIEFAADTVQVPLEGTAPSHLRRGRAMIAGTVVDDRGEAVAGARVSLEGAAGAAVTDAAGRFTLVDQPSGSGLLIVRKIGLSVAELPVALTAARLNDVSVLMTRQVPALAEVVVRARLDAALAQVGFISRRARRGGNLFLDPEAMERRVNRYSLANILAEAPNLRYENGTVVGRSRGYGMPSGINIPRRPSTCVRYLVDGYPWSVSGLDDPLAWLTPSDVAAIEVYWPGQVPPDLPNRGAVAYDRLGNACEVVVLWTRHKLATP